MKRSRKLPQSTVKGLNQGTWEANGDQSMVPGIILRGTGHEKNIEKELHIRSLGFILDEKFEHFHESPSSRMKLRGGNSQTLYYDHLKIGERQTHPQHGEKEFI